MKNLTFCFASLLLISTAYAQLVERPLPSNASSSSSLERQMRSARTQASGPLNLPFWDDFSYSDTLSYPREDQWLYGRSVLLNNGLGIHQPSKNVVTFDGVDSLGKPYNINDALAKGLADKLVSLPIRMDQVDAALRSTVYISFYYQVKGHGEAPDNGDQLILSFKNSDKKWESMFVAENSDAIEPDVFYQVLIPVADARFYHNDFQFRIQNFARLSGPYDTWNVDYVYLNSGRSPADTSYPDRTISTSLTSLFVDYYSMPIKHFLKNVSANLRKPTIELFNLRADNIQPFDYNTKATITTKLGLQPASSVNVQLDLAQDPGTTLNGLQFLNLTLNKIPSVSDFNPLADSVGIAFDFQMATKDNILPAQNGDYDPVKYSPIDFRVNDAIQTRYILSSYYAYDDGTAEYGAGLNQSGSYLAFKFLNKTDQPDTLVKVDIYFPKFGDNSSQSLQLQIRRDLSDSPSSILFQQNIQVARTTQNKFVTYKLEPPVAISGDFYVGWKQLSSASIPVGLDKNTDTGSKIYYNTNGVWVQNVSVKGSMMVRPGFGNPHLKSTNTGLESAIATTPIYPNPTHHTCYLPANAENIIAYDMGGKRMEIEIQPLPEAKALTFLSPVSGMVIVRYMNGGKSHAEKIMVQAE